MIGIRSCSRSTTVSARGVCWLGVLEVGLGRRRRFSGRVHPTNRLPREPQLHAENRLFEHRWPADVAVRVRMGIHSGEGRSEPRLRGLGRAPYGPHRRPATGAGVVVRRCSGVE